MLRKWGPEASIIKLVWGANKLHRMTSLFPVQTSPPLQIRWFRAIECTIIYSQQILGQAVKMRFQRQELYEISIARKNLDVLISHGEVMRKMLTRCAISAFFNHSFFFQADSFLLRPFHKNHRPLHRACFNHSAFQIDSFSPCWHFGRGAGPIIIK